MQWRIQDGRRHGYRSACLALAAILGFCTLHFAHARGPDKADYLNIQALDQRVLEAGFRLATANAPYCRRIEAVAGLSLHDIAQYKDRDGARAAFRFPSAISVLAVVPGGPADRAGIERSDGLLAIGANKVASARPFEPKGWDRDDNFLRLDRVLIAFENELATGKPDFSFVDGEGIAKPVPIIPARACQSRFQMKPDNEYRASADGRTVTITSRLAGYTADDAELAAVLAHELAHNILEHRARLHAAGVERDGLLWELGRGGALVRRTEAEADRLSVWLLANAGYDPQAAARFWRRYGKEHGSGIFNAPTHFNWKRRVETFEQEVAKIKTANRDENGMQPPLLAPPLLAWPLPALD